MVKGTELSCVSILSIEAGVFRPETLADRPTKGLLVSILSIEAGVFRLIAELVKGTELSCVSILSIEAGVFRPRC